MAEHSGEPDYVIGTAIGDSVPDPNHPGEHVVEVLLHSPRTEVVPELVAMVDRLQRVLARLTRHVPDESRLVVIDAVDEARELLAWVKG